MGLPARARQRIGPVLLTIAATLAATAASYAQTWPERSVRVINPFPAGGSGDAVIRIVFEKVSQALGQPFVAEARTGAAGSIGTDYVAKQPADGYTFILGTASTFGTNSSTQRHLPYDPVRDFTPVVMIASTPYLLLTHPSVPARTLDELVAWARKNPGKLNYGSFGPGSSNHLAYELLAHATGMELVHVPYKGGAPLIAALLGGEVQSSLDVYATAVPHVKAGKFNLLGVASARRFGLLPDTPTLTEQGHQVEGGTYFAVLGPARLPASIVSTLNREVNRALGLPDVRERLTALGVEIAGGTPEALAQAVASEVDKWAKLVKARGLKFE